MVFTIYTDFYYDGQYLNDFGYILCSFDDVSGTETVSSGSQITFNTTPIYNGRKQILLNTQYDECITSTFQICKNPCIYDDIELSPDDYRDIVCWLNRKEFLKFYLLDGENDYYDYYFEASFNCNAIKLGDKILGIELNMITNRPFAIHEPIIERFNMKDLESDAALSFRKIYKFKYISDEMGYIYPKIKITFNNVDSSLPFTFGIQHSGVENIETLELSKCPKGAVIQIEHPIITSSANTYDLFENFNFIFPTIGRSYKNDVNTVYLYNGTDYTKEKDIDVEIEYSPIVKVGV